MEVELGSTTRIGKCVMNSEVNRSRIQPSFCECDEPPCPEIEKLYSWRKKARRSEDFVNEARITALYRLNLCLLFSLPSQWRHNTAASLARSNRKYCQC